MTRIININILPQTLVTMMEKIPVGPETSMIFCMFSYVSPDSLESLHSFMKWELQRLTVSSVILSLLVADLLLCLWNILHTLLTSGAPEPNCGCSPRSPSCQFADLLLQAPQDSGTGLVVSKQKIK